MKKFTLQCYVVVKDGVVTKIGKSAVIAKDGDPVKQPEKKDKKTA